MEIRCGSCNKLFRISDDKITGKGIKFACTKCGGMVTITREEFEAYAQSRSAVPAPAVPETLEMPVPPASPDVQKETAAQEPVAAPTEVAPAEPSVPDMLLHEHTPPIEEPAPIRIPEPVPAAEPPKAEPRVVSEPQPDSARPAARQPEAMVRTAPPHREPVHHVPLAAERTAPSRSRGMLMLVLIILGVVGMAGYGVYRYLPTGTAVQKTEEPSPALSSTEGLQIVSATGAMDPTGDLVITSVIENSLSVERPAWYVVVDIFGTQGAMLSRIRVVNGKQLFTQRDYDILASRGINVQEMKTKNLEDQGTVVPPNGSVSFEIRYVQPQGGIASFNATLQPFDPVRMFKEISGEIK